MATAKPHLVCSDCDFNISHCEECSECFRENEEIICQEKAGDCIQEHFHCECNDFRKNEFSKKKEMK